MIPNSSKIPKMVVTIKKISEKISNFEIGSFFCGVLRATTIFMMKSFIICRTNSSQHFAPGALLFTFYIQNLFHKNFFLFS